MKRIERSIRARLIYHGAAALAAAALLVAAISNIPERREIMFPQGEQLHCSMAYRRSQERNDHE